MRQFITSPRRSCIHTNTQFYLPRGKDTHIYLAAENDTEESDVVFVP